MEKINLKENYNSWIKPDFREEMGEIKRVAKYFSNEDEHIYQKIIMSFKDQMDSIKLEPLSNEMWSKLENTDSWDLEIGDWEKVKEHVEYYNKTTGSNRNWKKLKERIDNNLDLNAPIIFEKDNVIHLVSGNTRLMTAKAAGKTPMVTIVHYK